MLKHGLEKDPLWSKIYIKDLRKDPLSPYWESGSRRGSFACILLKTDYGLKVMCIRPVSSNRNRIVSKSNRTTFLIRLFDSIRTEIWTRNHLKFDQKVLIYLQENHERFSWTVRISALLSTTPLNNYCYIPISTGFQDELQLLMNPFTFYSDLFLCAP